MEILKINFIFKSVLIVIYFFDSIVFSLSLYMLYVMLAGWYGGRWGNDKEMVGLLWIQASYTSSEWLVL